MAVTGDVDKLHPLFLGRLQNASKVTGIAISVTSGGRTRTEQQALVDGYANRLAWRGGGHRDDPANPYLHFNPANPVGTSRHEEQADGWAYAADLYPSPGYNPKLLAALNLLGVILTHSTEPWHVEPKERALPAVPHTKEEDDDVPKKVSSFALNINKPQDYASPAWRTIRGLLAAWGEPVTPDDANGDRTKAAVHSHARKWAAAVGADDGIVGPRFYGHLVSALNA